jgi:hypothetical protein
MQGQQQPTQNPQGLGDFQQALTKYRQQMSGAPSQVPGANLASPGGGYTGGGPYGGFNPQMPMAQPQGPAAQPQGQFQNNMMRPMPMPQPQGPMAQPQGPQIGSPEYQQMLSNAAAGALPQAFQGPMAQPMGGMQMDARVLDDGTSVGRDDPRFYGQGQPMMQGMPPQSGTARMQNPMSVGAYTPQGPNMSPMGQSGGATTATMPRPDMGRKGGFMGQEPMAQPMPRLKQEGGLPEIQGNPNAQPLMRSKGRRAQQQ